MIGRMPVCCTMPYTPIPTSRIADAKTRDIFVRASDYLADVYSMLSSRPLNRTNGGACNLTATLVLLCIVDAMATYIYPKAPRGRGSQGKRFQKLIVDKMRWGSETAGWTRKSQAAEILYREMRNTLTHALGVDRPTNLREKGFVEPTAGVWGNITPKRIGAIDARKSWPATWPVLSVLTDARGSRQKLTVAALYWHVKKMVDDLAASSQ